jgi:hypothetical protein
VDFIKQFMPYAWNLALCPSFSLINHHVIVPYAQFIAFSIRFGCALCFSLCTHILWNPP